MHVNNFIMYCSQLVYNGRNKKRKKSHFLRKMNMSNLTKNIKYRNILKGLIKSMVFIHNMLVMSLKLYVSKISPVEQFYLHLLTS